MKKIKGFATAIAFIGAVSILPATLAMADSQKDGSTFHNFGYSKISTSETNQTDAVDPEWDYPAGSMYASAKNMGYLTMEVSWQAESFIGPVTYVNIMTDWQDGTYSADRYSTSAKTKVENSNQHTYPKADHYDASVGGVLTVNYGLDSITYDDREVGTYINSGAPGSPR